MLDLRAVRWPFVPMNQVQLRYGHPPRRVHAQRDLTLPLCRNRRIR